MLSLLTIETTNYPHIQELSCLSDNLLMKTMIMFMMMMMMITMMIVMYDDDYDSDV
jgi:uncharacterized membrane protein YhdT